MASHVAGDSRIRRFNHIADGPSLEAGKLIADATRAPGTCVTFAK